MSGGVAGVRGSHKVLVMAWVRIWSGVDVRAGLSSSNPPPFPSHHATDHFHAYLFTHY